jgi:hypothetical protein
MIMLPPPNGHLWEWLAGLAVGVTLFILIIPFLERYLFPILDRYLNWVERKLSK